MKEIDENNFNRIVAWLGTKAVDGLIAPLVKKVIKDLQEEYKGQKVHIVTTISPKSTKILLHINSKKKKKKAYVVQYDAKGRTRQLAEINLVLQHIYNHVMVK